MKVCIMIISKQYSTQTQPNIIWCVCLCVCPTFPKKLEFAKKKKMEFAKKNGICTGFWIFGGRRPAAEGRSQSIEITLTTQDPHPILLDTYSRQQKEKIIIIIKIHQLKTPEFFMIIIINIAFDKAHASREVLVQVIYYC